MGKAARALPCPTEAARASWEEDWSSRLKHERGIIPKLLFEIAEAKKRAKRESDREDLAASERYFTNHGDKMRYWRHVKECLPIGSGVTEAACKVLVKERLCKSGMRWKNEGASCVIALRSLRMSTGRWDQFWSKVMRYGI